MTMLYVVIACGLLSVLYAIWATRSVLAADQGNARKPRIDRQPGFICPQVAAQLPSPTFSTTGC